MSPIWRGGREHQRNRGDRQTAGPNYHVGWRSRPEYGGTGNDTLRGGGDDDDLLGEDGDDQFLEGSTPGPNGSDLVVGAAGTDTISYAVLRRRGERYRVVLLSGSIPPMPWCPKHRWEFSWEGTKTCPACGSELVDALSPESEPVSDVAEPEADARPAELGAEAVGARRLGSFDRFAAPALLDLLTDRGIRAFEAPPMANPATRSFNSVSVDVWVEAARLEEAIAISDRDLPEVLAAIGDPAEELPADEIEAEEEDPIAYVVWAAFGWMEFAVARVFLEVCDEEGVAARTEFPLDKPIPPWAESYGRVQVEVEDTQVEVAEVLLETVEERLTSGGTAWAEPLCDLSGP